ncbi:hypothetical protein AHAS_Ahas06G0173800 [Arachis hypogaea]
MKLPQKAYKISAHHILPRNDQYISNGKYIRPPAATTSQPPEPAKNIPSPSTSQAPPTNQLLHQILERLDRLDRQRKQRERHNKRRFTYLKELLVGNHPPEEDPDSTSFTSTGSHDSPACGDTVTSPLCS